MRLLWPRKCEATWPTFSYFGPCPRGRTGKGLRIYQAREDGNRHLVDVRQVEELPPFEKLHGILVMAPPSLMQPRFLLSVVDVAAKSLTDSRDLAELLLTFPQLKSEKGLVAQRLTANRRGA